MTHEESDTVACVVHTTFNQLTKLLSLELFSNELVMTAAQPPVDV